MPLQLDDYDVSILRSLVRDGPERLESQLRQLKQDLPGVGFIKSVSPIFDCSLVENILKVEFDKGKIDSNNKTLYRQKSNEFKIKRGLKIKLKP